jgi:hypothetical protein
MNDSIQMLDPLPALPVEIIAILATTDRMSSYLDDKILSINRINTEIAAEGVKINK